MHPHGNLATGVKVNDMMDVTLVGTNLFNGGSGRYTLFQGGVPYYGITPNGPGFLPTDRLVTEPFGLKMVMTMKY